MKGFSLAAIFSSLNYPLSWKTHLDETFKNEFYRREHDIKMRRDLKTEEQWTRHAYALSKGKAHIYSYTIGYGGSKGQPIDPQTHPYMGILPSKSGHEIPFTIHGLLPESGTLGAHIKVQFQDIFNKMEQEVVFFGDSFEQINMDAVEWCQNYFNKCQQQKDSISMVNAEEIFWNPYNKKSLILEDMSDFMKQHFQTRSNSVPQDANPNIEFKITRRDGENSLFRVRICHIKI